MNSSFLKRRVERSNRAEHVCADVFAARRTFAELPEEFEEPVVRRRQLGRDRVPGIPQVQRHVEQAGDQVVCSLLKRVPITMSQAGEGKTATVCLLRQVQRWNPWFGHAHIVLRGSEVKTRAAVSRQGPNQA